MAYVEIILRHEGREYTIEVDNKSKPDEIIEYLLSTELNIDSNYRLLPVNSLTLEKNSIWELIKPPEKAKAKNLKVR